MAFSPVIFEKLDLLTRMQSRILMQFKGSPVFQAVLACFAAQKQEIADMFTGIMQSFVPYNATGVQQDALGRIVGSSRGIAEIGAWFTPDNPNYGFTDSKGPPVWVTNAKLTGTYTRNVTDYRNALVAKVFRNFVQVGSITDIQGFIRDMFGIESSVQITGGNQIKIIVPNQTSPQIISFLEASFSNDQVDNIYNVPLPPGVQIAEVVTFIPGLGEEPLGTSPLGE